MSKLFSFHTAEAKRIGIGHTVHSAPEGFYSSGGRRYGVVEYDLGRIRSTHRHVLIDTDVSLFMMYGDAHDNFVYSGIAPRAGFGCGFSINPHVVGSWSALDRTSGYYGVLCGGEHIAHACRDFTDSIEDLVNLAIVQYAKVEIDYGFDSEQELLRRVRAISKSNFGWSRTCKSCSAEKVYMRKAKGDFIPESICVDCINRLFAEKCFMYPGYCSQLELSVTIDGYVLPYATTDIAESEQKIHGRRWVANDDSYGIQSVVNCALEQSGETDESDEYEDEDEDEERYLGF